MQLLFASFFLAFVAFAAGQYIVLNQFAGYTTTDCSTTNIGASVYPVNKCIPSFTDGSSYYFNYSSSNTSQIIATLYSNSRECVLIAEAYTVTYVLGECSSTGLLPSYSATLPALSGYVSISDSTTTCPGSDPIEYNYAYYDVCLGLTSTTSFKYSYHGGGACVYESFNSTDCSGPAISGSSRSPSCLLGSSNACAVNGNFLPVQTAKESVPSGSQYITTRFYAPNDCSGTVVATVYSAATQCTGQGFTVTSSGETSTFTFYDNANCTGYKIFSYAYTSNLDLGVCDSELDKEDNTNHSSKSTLEAFPSGAAVSIGAITSDSCTNPTQTFYAYNYNGGCLRANSTTSGRISCTVNGANTTITTTFYATTDCTGASSGQDVDSYLTCSENFNSKGVSEGTYTKYVCNPVLPGTSSDAAPSVKSVASSSVLFAVVAMVLAVYVV